MTIKKQPRARYEYRVHYRRRGWTQRQCRTYERIPALQAFIARLHRTTGRWAGLEPVVELSVQQRSVGEWRDLTRPQMFDVYHHEGPR